MRVIGNSRIAIIGKLEEVEDGGIKLLKLIFSSVRGDYARTRLALKPAGLPNQHDERGDDKDQGGVTIL